MNNILNKNGRFFKTIAISISCLFMFSNLSFATQTTEIHGNSHTLAPTTRAFQPSIDDGKQADFQVGVKVLAISEQIAGHVAEFGTDIGEKGLRKWLEDEFSEVALRGIDLEGLREEDDVFYLTCIDPDNDKKIELSFHKDGRVEFTLVEDDDTARAPEKPERDLPDGSPYKIYQFLLELTKEADEGVTAKAIQPKTKGRAAKKRLSIDRISRDLNTLFFVGLAEKKGTGETATFKAVDLHPNKWTLVEPILKSLGREPRSRKKKEAKRRITGLLEAFEELDPIARELLATHKAMSLSFGGYGDTYVSWLKEYLEDSDKRKGEGTKLIERGRELIARIKKLSLRRKALERKDALQKFEKMVITLLKQQGYVVVANFVGSPGVGKTTISNILDVGIAGISPSEIMTIHADQFNHKVDKINDLIQNRDILNKPLKALTPEEFEVLTAIVKEIGRGSPVSVPWPSEREGEHTFLNYYNWFRATEHGFGTTHVLRKKNLAGSSNVGDKLQTLSADEFERIKELAYAYGIKEEALKERLDKSLWEIFLIQENEEAITAVRKSDPIYTPVRLFDVEGTYSKYGQAVFDQKAERLAADITVHIEIDDIVELKARVQGRGRTRVEEELLEVDLLSVAYSTTFGIERERADIILNNTKKLNEYQIVELAYSIIDKLAQVAGKLKEMLLTVQFGIPTETAKDIINWNSLGGSTTDVFVIPPELFHGGRNYADIEFILYFKYFFQGGQRVTLVGTPEQLENLEVILQESLFGPDPEGEDFQSYDKDTRLIITTARENYAVRGPDGQILPLSAFVDFIPLEDGKAIVEKDEVQFEINMLNQNTFSVHEVRNQKNKKVVEIDYRAPTAVIPKISEKQKRALLDAPNQRFAITPFGTSDGFDVVGDYTNFAVWLEGEGILVDPSPRALDAIDALGLDESRIPYVFLTHAHADHDGGLLRRILTKRRIKLITSKPVYDNFIKKAQKLVGPEFKVKDWIDFIEVNPAKPLELKLSNGKTARIDVRCNLHSIPTLGFKIAYEGYRFGYSGDTEYLVHSKDLPEGTPDWIKGIKKGKGIKELLAAGKITPQQAEDLLYFFWDKDGKPTVDLLFHEAGVPPIHTLPETLLKLPDAVKELMHLVHLADNRVPEGLRKARDYGTYILMPADEKSRHQMMVDTVKIASMSIANLTPDKWDQIVTEGTIKKYKKGNAIIREGDEVDEDSEFYILLSGSVDIRKAKDGVAITAGGFDIQRDTKHEFRYGGRGDSFGEIGLEKSIPRTAFVIADNDVEVLVLNLEQYRRLISNPELRKEIEAQMRNLDLLQKWVLNSSSKSDDDDVQIGQLSPHALKHMANKGRRKIIKKGTTIIEQGDEKAEEFFIIASGEVMISIEKDDGQKEVVARLDENSPKNHFGEMALLGDKPRNATVVAETDVEVFVLKKEDFNHIVREHPGIEYSLVGEAAARERALNGFRRDPNSDIARSPSESEGDETTPLTIEAAEQIARDFQSKVIRWVLDHPGEKLIIGLEDSWIPDTQLAAIQEFLAEIDEISKKPGRGSVMIHRQKGTKLADEILDLAQAEKTPLSNVIILGREKELDELAFDVLRGEEGAFFAKVEKPTNFPEDSYIGFVDILTLAIKLAFRDKGDEVPMDYPFVKLEPDEDCRAFRFIPKAIAIDIDTDLRELYEKQLSIVIAA